MSAHDGSPYHHGNLADSLVAAATDLLEEEGVTGISLRRVARDAGVSHAAPYRHFRDKHDLLEAVAAAGFDELGARFRRVLAHHTGSPREMLLAACEAYVEQVLERPARCHLMFGGALGTDLSERLRTASETSFAELVAVIRHGEESGLFRPGISTRDLVLTLWPAAHGLAMLAAADHLSFIAGERSPGELVTMLVNRLLDGLAVPDGEPAPSA